MKFYARRNNVGGQDTTSAHTSHATAHKRGCDCERNRSRGFTVVVLQNAAEAMFAFDLTRIKRNDAALIVGFPARQKLSVVMINNFHKYGLYH